MKKKFPSAFAIFPPSFPRDRPRKYGYNVNSGKIDRPSAPSNSRFFACFCEFNTESTLDHFKDSIFRDTRSGCTLARLHVGSHGERINLLLHSSWHPLLLSMSFWLANSCVGDTDPRTVLFRQFLYGSILVLFQQCDFALQNSNTFC